MENLLNYVLTEAEHLKLLIKYGLRSDILPPTFETRQQIEKRLEDRRIAMEKEYVWDTVMKDGVNVLKLYSVVRNGSEVSLTKIFEGSNPTANNEFVPIVPLREHVESVLYQIEDVKPEDYTLSSWTSSFIKANIVIKSTPNTSNEIPDSWDKR